MRPHPVGAISQAVILVGGTGSRLGEATASRPKPMLDVGGRPFLLSLIREWARYGLNRLVLLAGYQAAVLEDYFRTLDSGLLPEGLSVEIAVEPSPLGTAGALRAAGARLDDYFIMGNGDSFCDCDLLKLTRPLVKADAVGRVALRPVAEAGRYGSVRLEGTNITGFQEKNSAAGPGLVNAGIYFFNRMILEEIPPGPASLERDVFPALARAGRLEGLVLPDSYFIDIGIPEDLARARRELASALTRPAVFFDRDGVLNADHGHVHRWDDFHWLPGARESILAANEAGRLVFVVTNQAGLAKGLYREEDMHRLHEAMKADLRRLGAHIDAVAFCPHHPEGLVPGLRRVCDCRKPAPGLLLNLMKTWPVDRARSFMIGDKASDVAAARAAGLAGHLFPGGDLLEFVKPLLAARESAAPR